MRRIFIGVFLLLCLVIIIVLLWQKSAGSLLSEENKLQAAEKILGRKIRTSEDIPTGNIEYKGRYFTLRYPASAQMVQKESESTISSRLEYLELKSYQPVFFTFVAQVFKTQSSLSEYSAVKYRREQKEMYKEESIRTNQELGIVFIKLLDGGEKTAFFLKNGKLYSFSLRGGSSISNEIFDQLIKTITFQ